MSVKVPMKALEGIDAVRASGTINMFDISMVIRICFEMGYYASVTWIRKNVKQYSIGVFEGFEPCEAVAEGEQFDCPGHETQAVGNEQTINSPC